MVPRNLPWPESYSIIWQIGIIHGSAGWASQVVWNIQYITAFIPAWMVPPIFHSIQAKNPKQPGELGHRTIRPTWFEDDTSLHGQKQVPTQGALLCSIQYHWRDSSAHRTVGPFNLQRAASKDYTSELKHWPMFWNKH